MLRNPFYCGLLAHSALEAELVEGIQEKVISKDLFLKVNGIMDNRHRGYSQRTENDNVPLKRFLTCDDCSRFLTLTKHRKTRLIITNAEPQDVIVIKEQILYTKFLKHN